MQYVAMEINHAETAFLLPMEGGFSLRWFTPTVEVDLCGHATLAAAQVLFERELAEETVHFHTRSGLLIARQVGQEIELDFPAEAPWEAEVTPLRSIPNPVWKGRNRMDWYLQLASEAEVLALQPDLAEIAQMGMRGLIVTVPGAQTDFVSRCFFPQSGVDEDSVTGSAHCAMAPYWSQRLGREQLVGFQASRRGGRVTMRVEGDRVRLAGPARIVVRGTLEA